MKKRVRFVISMVLIALIVAACIACGEVSTKTPNIMPHLLSETDAEKNPVRHIDSAEEYALTDVPEVRGETYYFDRQTELYNVVLSGYKPVFAADDPVKPVYDAAIALLNRYVKNEWTDYQRVHTIHDYLTYEVAYDKSLYNDYLAGAQVYSNTHDSFNLSGVLIKKLAVCDGIAKSFSFLCAIEGIESERISGVHLGETEVPHAWNTVKLNLDGEERTYLLDATLDKAEFEITDASGEKTSLVMTSHAYFLRSQAVFSASHRADEEVTGCDVDFNYFDNKYVKISGVSYALNVRSADDLKKIFTAVKNSNRAVGKIEVRLNFRAANGDYSECIAAAYAAVSDKDFNNAYVCNGGNVFLFLIYT